MGEHEFEQKVLTKAIDTVLQAQSNEAQELRLATPGGRFQVRWDEGGSATALGQLPFFAEFLEVSGFFAGNWWSWYVRLAHPQARRGAITSRPMLLSGVARLTEHAGQSLLLLTLMHAEGLDGVRKIPPGMHDRCCCRGDEQYLWRAPEVTESRTQCTYRLTLYGRVRRYSDCGKTVGRRFLMFPPIKSETDEARRARSNVRRPFSPDP